MLRPSEEPAPLPSNPETEPQAPEPAKAEPVLLSFPEDLPDFEGAYPDYEAQPGNAKPRLLAGIAKGLSILILTLILLLQLAWFEREQLVYSPGGRSLLSSLCRVAGCEPPPRRDLSQFDIVSRSILPRPEQSQVLDLRLVFANRASFSQPYPRIQVSLLNPQGQPTAKRTFAPHEYLGPGTNPTSLLQPQEEVPVSLNLVNPDAGQPGYRFDFL